MGALEELLERVSGLSPKQRAEIEAAALEATASIAWVPNPGPQTAAYFSEADELLYGGEAGGGKSDLLIGLGLTAHRNSRILRRINQDAVELGDRLCEILGTSRGYRSQPPTWRGDGRRIELRGCEQEKDKQRFKGRARDFIGYDELADFLESQYVFINTWNRSTVPGQRCRVVGGTNGPTSAEGQWIVKRWGAWLDPKHPRPAKDGELRFYLTLPDGNEVEVEGPGPHEVKGRMVRATSRSFIRSRLSDNPDLNATDYGSRLDALPEELRRVYRDGDFTLGLKDDDWQVVPTAWIEASMQRWTPQMPRVPMSAVAVDVAPGGGDRRVIGSRYNGWFSELDAKKEVDKTGRSTAADVVKVRRDNCPVIVDLGGGWGGDAVIALKDNAIDCVAFLGVAKSTARSRDGKFGFFNKRAEIAWKMREELDPSQEGGSAIALPPDQELKAELASYRFEIVGSVMAGRGTVKVTDKEEQKARIGRSPDKGDTVLMLLVEGNRMVERAARAGRASTLVVNTSRPGSSRRR